MIFDRDLKFSAEVIAERWEAIQRGSVSEAEWGGQTRTATAQNGQNEPHYQPKEGRAICG